MYYCTIPITGLKHPHTLDRKPHETALSPSGRFHVFSLRKRYEDFIIEDMKQIQTWIVTHKLLIFLGAIILFLLLRPQNTLFQTSLKSRSAITQGSIGMVANDAIAPMPAMEIGKTISGTSSVSYAVPQERMVTVNTTVSMVVKQVKDALGTIEKLATDTNGFMVHTSLSTPEGASNGNITIRVPTEKRTEVLNGIRALGIRVVDEQVQGEDITDQYSDLDAQLTILMDTKSRIEVIMKSATEVQDMLNVQRELISLQSQIDNVKGRKMYLEKSANLSLITVYLSTDDLSLPYSPDQPWRPQVTFKLAVRALVTSARDMVDKLIWLVVFAPIWLPAGIIAWVIYRKMKSAK